MKTMAESRRKSPADLTLKSKRTPLSTRVKSDTKRVLAQAAKTAKTTVSDLSAAILDDYAEWLKEQELTK